MLEKEKSLKIKTEHQKLVEAKNMLQLAELAEQFEEEHKESDIFDLEDDILKVKTNSERVEAHLFELKNLRLPNNVCLTPLLYRKCFLSARDLPI